MNYGRLLCVGTQNKLPLVQTENRGVNYGRLTSVVEYINAAPSGAGIEENELWQAYMCVGTQT